MDFKKWLRDDILERHGISVDVYGQPTWSTPVTIKGRIIKKMKQRIDRHGQEYLSDCQVYTDTDVGIDSQLQLPGDDYRSVRTVGRSRDKTGSSVLWEVSL